MRIVGAASAAINRAAYSEAIATEVAPTNTAEPDELSGLNQTVFAKGDVMTARKIALTLLLLAGAGAASAETPKDFVAQYAAEAGPGFKPSAARGKEFFNKDFGVSQDMPSCTSCHTRDVNASGKHVITGKVIEPLAPAANPERFTTAKKVEKWFKRNCKEVLGRECTPAEKADFIQLAIEGGKA
jgi:hypothetical protein